MAIDPERWHDGAGYDLELLRRATPAERGQIEELLLAGGARDWRSAEALAALDSPRANEVLRQAFARGDDALRVTLVGHAPRLFGDAERAAALVSALGTTEVYGGLTQTLLLVEEWHPAAVVEALLRGVLERDGETAGLFAAQLLYLHELASSPDDPDQRPLCLAFQDGDRVELFRELCGRIGVGAIEQDRWLAAARRR